MRWQLVTGGSTAGASPMSWHLCSEGGDVRVSVRRHRGAKRMVLRIRPAVGDALLTLPHRASLAEGAEFVQERGDWLFEQFRDLPPATQFADDAIIPILDIPHRVRHDPTHRGTAVIEDGEVRVAGRLEFLPRRLTDCLKTRAKQEITPRAHELAARVDRAIGRISVRDTRSRWGSCAANGNLSFCWRLIMTPEWVLQYVVAHEVAHLVAANHSSAFWDVVDSLDVDARGARCWLNENSARLHRIG